MNNITTLTCLGWDERLSAGYQRHDRPDQWPARVSRVERGVCTLLGPDGLSRASLAGRMLAAAARDATRLPCPGDWVVVRNWPDCRPTVEVVLPRRGIVWRTPGPGPSASNVDLMMTVDGSTDPDLHVVGALRALAAPGRTLGLVGADTRSRAAVVTALAGAAVLPPIGGALVPLPDGGAVIDIHGDTSASVRTPRAGSSAGGRAVDSGNVSIHWDDIDVSTLIQSTVAHSTWADAR
jgi:ribosome biogenesis GTPase